MGLELGNIWISSEEVDTFLLRSLRPTLLSLGLRCWHASGAREGKGRGSGNCGETESSRGPVCVLVLERKSGSGRAPRLEL